MGSKNSASTTATTAITACPPMDAYCGEYPLSVELRPANVDGAAGAKAPFERIVTKLRTA